MERFLINSKKNYTPIQISLIGAFILLTFFTLVLLLLSVPVSAILVTVPILGLVTWWILDYLIEVFIHRKIKLIFKSIRAVKTGKDHADDPEFSKDPLGNIEREVHNWSEVKSNEIAQLKSVEKFRKEFLANLSHELKTPLFNIQGYVHTLLESEIEDADTRNYFLQRTVKSIERLNNLISDLDEISKLERGEYSIHYSSFDIQQLIREVFEGLELKAQKRGIRMGFKREANHPFWVYADKDKIKQVLSNLTENSIKYGRENGETIVGIYDMDDRILVELTDNGIGIEEEHLPRLFERFYRVDRHRSREQGGTGLGLAIVKHIIEAHNETINVRSKPGLGTTFGFSLQKSSED